eukprot:s965_g21.t1
MRISGSSIRQEKNYSSAEDFAAAVRATFVEESHLHMVEGPFTRSKLPPAVDASPLNCVQALWQPLTRETRSGPSTMALRVEPSTFRTRPKRAPQPPQSLTVSRLSIGYMLPRLRTPGSRCPWPGGTGAPHTALAQPPPGQQWILLKADVTKAHRRIKILPKDWRYQVAELQQEWWINKVGTYGMASAQLYWG